MNQITINGATYSKANPYIISEIGSNWSTLDDCLSYVSLMHNLGANAIKFQVFKLGELTGWNMASGIDVAALTALKQKADACGIDLICSSFNPKTLKEIDPFVHAHKIASSENNWPELIDAASSTGKPVFISTGGSSIADIRHIIYHNEELRRRLCVMYCVGAYPSYSHDLRCLDVISQFDVAVGFSDHSKDVYCAPYEAINFHGAIAVEKHVYDPTICLGLDSVDLPHSITTYDFKRMCQAIRNEKQPFFPQPEEKEMLLRHKRRLVATRDIKEGDWFVKGDNFDVLRSLENDTGGLPPSFVGKLSDFKATRNIEAFTPITIGDFKK